MESVNAKLSSQQHNVSRILALFGSVLVALSSGTNYIYSAYAPQLGAHLRISHTQINIIGLAGNMGVYISGLVWGRIVDHKGPQIPLIGCSICLLVGYLGIKQMYDEGIGNGATISSVHFTFLVACSLMTGVGGSAGLGAALNTTAKSFPSAARATTTSLVLSGYGLSAFWFSLLARTLFPGDISALLLILALGTAIPVLMCLAIVKPIPLYAANSHATIEGYGSVPSRDGIGFVEEARAVVNPEAAVEAEEESATLLSHRQEPMTSHRERSAGDKDELPDIHGKRLWLTPDFYLIFVILSICCGTGVMYINNVGSISQALYAKTHPVYDDIEASKWQAAQVSILSLGNFTGRVLMGLISDFAHIRLRIPRAYSLCIVSSLFIVSQVSAIVVSSVEALWAVTLLVGLAYGSLFGSFPTIMIEWFGLAHFSENCGYVSLAFALGSNLFSLMFGRYLDAHVPVQDTRPSSRTRVLSLISLGSRELPSEHQCFDGKECYLGCFQVTLVACVISLGLSWWAGIRDSQKIKARKFVER